MIGHGYGPGGTAADFGFRWLRMREERQEKKDQRKDIASFST